MTASTSSKVFVTLQKVLILYRFVTYFGTNLYPKPPQRYKSPHKVAEDFTRGRNYSLTAMRPLLVLRGYIMQQSHFSIEYKVSDTWKLFTQTHNENSAIYIARDLAKSVHGLRVINPFGETVYISE